MSRTNRSDDAVAPGFEYWYADGARKPMLLPTWLALELLEAAGAREAEERAARQAEKEAKDALQAEEPAKSEKLGGEAGFELDLLQLPAQGFYRVLPNMDLRTYADETSFDAPDKDIRERRSKLAKQLYKLGPDRKLAHPKHWRTQVEGLGARLPNFAKPIRIVRNALAMAVATGKAVRIPPLLLIGPPGVGKTYFSQSLAQMLQAPHFTISFDQPSAGSQLRGSDKHWGNTESGLLFNQICLGTHANPVILLDEIDKVMRYGRSDNLDPLVQLHSVLEPQSSSRLVDISTEIEFDASQVTYIATANTLHGLTVPILSRFEVIEIAPPTRLEAVEIARGLADALLDRLGLRDKIKIHHKVSYVLGVMSPRLMKATLEKVVANAVYMQESLITEAHVWREVDAESGDSPLH